MESSYSSAIGSLFIIWFVLCQTDVAIINTIGEIDTNAKS